MEGYLVRLCVGEAWEWSFDNKFVTTDEEVAKKWVERFNEIVKKHSNRMYEIMFRGEEQPFWCDFIIHQKPVADYVKIELR